MMSNIAAVVQFAFQFQSGSIKTANIIINRNNNCSFNSNLVRLKLTAANTVVFAEMGVSIPIWFD